MNSEQYIKRIPGHLIDLKTTFEGGLTLSGTDLTDIKTNTNDTAVNTFNTATNTSTLSDCVWVAQNQLKVDLKTLNDTTIETNAGNVTAGCPRVCIATDDINLSTLAGTVNMAGLIATDMTSVNGTNTATNAGNVNDGSQRICIATDDVNISTINQSTSDLALSLNGLYEVGVNFKGINDNPISAGDGNNDTGTLRVTMARDDYNLSQLITNASGYLPAFHVNLRGIHNGAEDKTIAVQSGNVSDGTPRICIATDDVNLANINAILSDVWDSTAHTLKVSIVP